MKKIFVLLSLFLVSCNQVCDKFRQFCTFHQPTSQKVDLSKIDQYPTFERCNHLLDNKALKTCFQETLFQELTDGVDSLKLSTPILVHETIQVHFEVNKKGKIYCKTIQSSPSLHKQIPHLKDSIQKVFNQLESVQPAQKRGIPVNANFTIPLEIITQE